MTNQEIPQDRWEQFFEDFSNQHEGQPVRIELMNRDIGDQPFADAAPLLGISCDTKGSRAGSIEITAGEDADSLVSHVIDRPAHVRLATGDQADTIEIQSDNESTVLIQLMQQKGLPA
jgi:hypothetical protein